MFYIFHNLIANCHFIVHPSYLWQRLVIQGYSPTFRSARRRDRNAAQFGAADAMLEEKLVESQFSAKTTPAREAPDTRGGMEEGEVGASQLR